ncbi:MAG: aspartate--tRNA ligase [Patescibacteria group bacterium]|nr:aspartate--tRNA ligase [Patescibacteria group bacterium]MDE1945921.1 aspartate--tRNA ligase [Patescibacteria group bacterium]
MKRTYIGELNKEIGKEVKIAGWVDVRRDHGKLIFIDLRDMSGKVQMVALPNHAEAHEMANTVRPEWVVEVTGKVNARPERMVNKDEANGTIEIEILSMNVLNEAVTPPFDVRGDGRDIGEDARLSHRWLDLRRPRLQKNIRNRSSIMTLVRTLLAAEGFTEIETPNLTNATAEGSRDFIVPSRLEPGNFYALPQSPQQYKQLLMAAGFEKYFQFARCFRDEDSRGDRQPEFTQMDLEMSFATEEDVMAVNEKVIIEVVKKLYPHKKIQEIPFPKIPYAEAMAKYGTDKPDLRKDKNDLDLLAFAWTVDFPMFEKGDDGKWTFTHNPFSTTKPESMGDLMAKKNIETIMAAQYDLVLNGNEAGGGSIRNHRPEALRKTLEIMDFSAEKIESQYGHMLRAFETGVPPHGGIAWGLDRLVMILENEPNIRETIAFAKSGEGRDLMMNAPGPVSAEQLRDLRIEIKKKK